MYLGDYLVMRPLPADPVGVLFGKYAGGPAADEARRQSRDDDASGRGTPTVVILLDAYAVIAYLTGESHAGPAVRSLLAEGAITSVNAAEVLDHLVRVRGAAEAEAALDLAQLGLTVVDVDDEVGTRAGLLRARHYHRVSRAVSLADCIAAAVGLVNPQIDGVATSDAHLLDLLHAEAGRTHPLPDRRGVVWRPN